MARTAVIYEVPGKDVECKLCPQCGVSKLLADENWSWVKVRLEGSRGGMDVWRGRPYGLCKLCVRSNRRARYRGQATGRHHVGPQARRFCECCDHYGLVKPITFASDAGYLVKKVCTWCHSLLEEFGSADRLEEVRSEQRAEIEAERMAETQWRSDRTRHPHDRNPLAPPGRHHHLCLERADRLSKLIGWLRILDEDAKEPTPEEVDSDGQRSP